MKQTARVLKRKENTKKTIVRINLGNIFRFPLIRSRLFPNLFLFFLCFQKQMEKIQSETLRKIFIQLAEHIFDDGAKRTNKSTIFCGDDKKKIPHYNHWYRLVNDEIEKFDLPKPIMFSWLTNKQRQAVMDLGEHLTPDITNIDDPSEKDFTTMKYPDVKLEHFTDAYKSGDASTLPIHVHLLSPDNVRSQGVPSKLCDISEANIRDK